VTIVLGTLLQSPLSVTPSTQVIR